MHKVYSIAHCKKPSAFTCLWGISFFSVSWVTILAGGVRFRDLIFWCDAPAFISSLPVGWNHVGEVVGSHGDVSRITAICSWSIRTVFAICSQKTLQVGCWQLTLQLKQSILHMMIFFFRLHISASFSCSLVVSPAQLYGSAPLPLWFWFCRLSLRLSGYSWNNNNYNSRDR